MLNEKQRAYVRENGYLALLRTWFRVWLHRAQDRWHDLRAVLAGYCNDCPRKTGLPGDGGGYHHWRCALKRGHAGLHRFRNYVWDQAGQVEYASVAHPPSQPWSRNGTLSRRQARERERWLQQRYAKTLARDLEDSP